jgi:hypothetical protein
MFLSKNNKKIIGGKHPVYVWNIYFNSIINIRPDFNLYKKVKNFQLTPVYEKQLKIGKIGRNSFLYFSVDYFGIKIKFKKKYL